MFLSFFSLVLVIVFLVLVLIVLVLVLVLVFVLVLYQGHAFLGWKPPAMFSMRRNQVFHFFSMLFLDEISFSKQRMELNQISALSLNFNESAEICFNSILCFEKLISSRNNIEKK